MSRFWTPLVQRCWWAADDGPHHRRDVAKEGMRSSRARRKNRGEQVVKMFTPKQVAEQVGVSASLVYEWCAQGLLRHYRFGSKGRRGSIRIEEKDLDDFLLNCSHDHRQEDPPPPLRHIKLS
jgi:excisionase family DNA binding protein